MTEGKTGPAARPVPLSEDQRKYRDDWSPDDCLDHLRSFAETHPGQFISRTFFRSHSAISDATWNRYFGTFQEFRRQAGLELSRHAHRLERDVAKHASADLMRALSHDKRLWEGRYERPSGRRFQTALVASDLHDLDCDPFYRRVLVDLAGRARPERIVLDGDLFDLPEFSKYQQDPREFRLVERIRWVHALLADLRAASPESEITLVEGNHEFRLLRHLAEASPAMRVVLADLHGMTVAGLLGLEAYEVNLVARSDLAAWTERDVRRELARNYVVLWDAMLFGHFPELRHKGFPGASGHHHRHALWSGYSPTFGPYEWHQLGCGCRRRAVYCDGEEWGNGLLLAHCDTSTRRSQMEYVDLSHGHAFAGGRLYLRGDGE